MSSCWTTHERRNLARPVLVGLESASLSSFSQLIKDIPFETAREEAVKYILKGQDKEGLEVKMISKQIGRGLFAARDYKKGEFLVEYHGELISRKEGEERLKKYPTDIGSYIYFFISCDGKRLCIDATFSKRNGRFANDAGPGDKKQNAVMKKVLIDRRPYLALFATRKITAGQEIRYDYNDNICNLPWRQKAPKTKNPKPNERVDLVIGSKTKTEAPKTKNPKPNERVDLVIGSKTKTEVTDCIVKLFRLPSFLTMSCGNNAATMTTTTTNTTAATRDIQQQDFTTMTTTTRCTSARAEDNQQQDFTTMTTTTTNTTAATRNIQQEDFTTMTTTTRCTSARTEDNQQQDFTTIYMTTTTTNTTAATRDIQQQDFTTMTTTTRCTSARAEDNQQQDFTTMTTTTTNTTAATRDIQQQDFTTMTTTTTNTTAATRDIQQQDFTTMTTTTRCTSARTEDNQQQDFTKRCEICDITYQLETSLQRHIITCHPGDLKQENCNIRNNEENLKKEDKLQDTSVQQEEKNSDILKCGRCNFTCSSIPLFLKHKRNGCDTRSVQIYPENVEIPEVQMDELLVETQGPSGLQTSIEKEKPTDFKDKQPKSGNLNQNYTEKPSRPKRPCPFCGKLVARLTNHLIAIHKDEEQVKIAVQLPKKSRDRAFDLLKKEGISKRNQEPLKKEKPDTSEFMVERNQGKGPLAMCSMCKGVFKKKTIYRHISACPAAEGTTSSPQIISVSLLQPDPKYSDSYRRDILQSFRNSEYGNLIRNDDWIKRYGSYLYQNISGSCKRAEKRRSLTSKLRRLAHLFLMFKKIVTKDCKISVQSCSEMFDRRFIPYVQEAITELTKNEKTNAVKDGLKVSYRYLMGDVCKIMQANYLISMEDEKAEELTKFMTILHSVWPSFFASAEESILTKRQAELRAPARLPNNKDINRLRDYTKETIDRLSGNEYKVFDLCEFCKLRDALVCRLTLFNARRGGEPCRMTLSEWHDACTGKWVNPQKIEVVTDEISKSLLCKTKIAYIHASKLTKLVPVLIPEDCWKALNLISDESTRDAAGINKQNKYIFPNVKLSTDHVSGWLCVSKMCTQAGLGQHINATDMRHYVATMYALLDVSQKDREVFCAHLGHSLAVNEHVYQSPASMREITQVGRFLTNIDQATGLPSNHSIADHEDGVIAGPSNAGMHNHQLMGDHEDGAVAGPSIENTTETAEDVLKLEEFLEAVAEKVPVLEVLDLDRMIQESEVEIDIESLEMQSTELLLNENIQNIAKPYFSRQAWESLKSVLDNLPESKMQKEISQAKEPTSTESKQPRRGMKRKGDVGKTSQQKAAKHREATRGGACLTDTNYSSDESDDDSDYDEEAVEVETEETQTKSSKRKRLRHTWSEAEDEAIRTFFDREINDVSTTGNRGTLQIANRVEEFLEKYPDVLKEYKNRDRKKKVRVKVLNLRKKIRENYHRNLNQIRH